MRQRGNGTCRRTRWDRRAGAGRRWAGVARCGLQQISLAPWCRLAQAAHDWDPLPRLREPPTAMRALRGDSCRQHTGWAREHSDHTLFPGARPCCATLCARAWAYGRVGVWAYGRVGVWACGCMDVWACGCMDVWAYGRVGVWVYGRMGVGVGLPHVRRGAKWRRR